MNSSLYDFSSDETLKALRLQNGELSIKYVGSATSHFQAEPLYCDDTTCMPPVTDWELELMKNINGESSGIKERQKREDLPRFLYRDERYIKRSKEIGENMFRLSIDFGRLCPKPYVFNGPLMEKYARTLALIRMMGQEPMLTLHHFTMPKFLTKIDQEGFIRAGGWEHPRALEAFRFYVTSVAGFLADKDTLNKALEPICPDRNKRGKIIDEGIARHFVTLNEPNIAILNGYLLGIFPPYRKAALVTAMKVSDTLVKAHDIATGVLKTLEHTIPTGSRQHIGVGYSWQYFDGPMGSLAHSLLNEYHTRRSERDGNHSDFLDLHYYFRMTFPFFLMKSSRRDYANLPSFGDIYPKGLLAMIEKMHKLYPQKEMFISEFGFSAARDRRRPFWLLETVRYALEALRRGSPVRGILLWSLVDNFEWNFGMQQKFGLFSERELEKPLVSDQKTLRSWEAWRDVARALTHPSKKSLEHLQLTYRRAQTQYREAKASALRHKHGARESR